MKTILVAGCSLFASACLCHSTIVTFNFTGTNPGQNSPWNTGTTLDPNATTAGFTLGSGVSGNTGNNRFNANNWSTAATLSSAISGNDFFGFSLTPNSGYVLNLNSAKIAFTLQVSSTGPHSYSLMSSIGGFTSGAELQNGAFVSGAQIASFAYTFASTGNNGISSPVEFRFYGFNASGTTGAGTMSMNALSLDGTVTPVPEPAGWGVISGFGLLAIFGLRTWRERRNSIAAN